MKMIIEAHWVDDCGHTERVQLASINRDLTTDPLGLSLAEGKAPGPGKNPPDKPSNGNC